jgi:DNA-binding transcriptional regulator YhcF (GntR family)
MTEQGPIETKYKQIQRILATAIGEERLQIGSLLPSESELMRRFGVSRVTVRRALRDLVRDGLVEKRQGVGHIVRAAIPQPCIGMIYGNIQFEPEDSAFYRLLLAAYAAELARRNCRARLYYARSHHLHHGSGLADFKRDIQRGHLNGAIGAAWPAVETTDADLAREDRELLDFAVGKGISYSGNTSLPLPGTVGLDYRGMGYMGTAHFLARGLRRVALVCGSPQHEAVYLGYVDAMREHDQRVKPEWVCRANELSPAAGYAAFGKIWSAPERPEAVILSDDVLAQGVFTAILELGVDVPGQLQVATHCIKGSELFFTKSYVRLEIDPAEIAREVVDRLLAMIEQAPCGLDRTLIKAAVIPWEAMNSPAEKARMSQLIEV